MTIRRKAQEARIAIAGVEVAFQYVGPGRLLPTGLYDAFRGKGKGSAAWQFSISPPPFPELRRNRLVFGTSGNWRVFEAGGGPALTFGPTNLHRDTTEMILFRRRHERTDGSPFCDAVRGHGEIIMRNAEVPGAPLDPVDQPMGSLLWRQLFPSHDAILLHAAGIVLNGHALLFFGHSRAGKTTFLNQFSDTAGVKLSDDRVAVRRVHGGGNPHWRAFGTPWYGEGRIADPANARLGALYLVERSPRDRIERITGAKAAAEILARSFPPYWSRAGMERTAGLAIDLALHVPVFRLGFVPGPSAAEMARKHAPSGMTRSISEGLPA